MSRASRWCGHGRWRRRLLGTSLLLAALTRPPSVGAQLSDPCGAACGAALVATGVVTATGTVAALARLSGGLSTTSQGIWTWGTSFALVVGGGVALAGDGERQERAVYAAGIGSGVGAALGLAIAGLTDSGDGSRMLGGTLIGAAVGALAGGVYGALDDSDDTFSPSLSVIIPF